MARRRGRAGNMQPLNAVLQRVLPAQYEFHTKLEKAAAEWALVVGPALGRQSAPIDMTDGELLIAADTPLVASRLSMMGGNVARALLERYRLEIRNVKVIVGKAPPRPSAPPRRTPPTVRVKEEDVRAIEQSYLEQSPDLPADVAGALARFQAFFTKRFGV